MLIIHLAVIFVYLQESIDQTCVLLHFHTLDRDTELTADWIFTLMIFWVFDQKDILS